MGNLFSSQKKDKQKITPRDRAVLDLKVQRDRLKQYQKKISAVLEREMEIARLFLRDGNKAMALLALKKKKYQESLLESTSSQLMNLEQLTSTIEFTQVEQQVMQGLRQGNFVLAELQKETSLEEVEKLMDDTAEAVAYQNEISAALAGKLTVEDEEDLEKELLDLQTEVMPSTPEAVSKEDEDTMGMPNVPDKEIELEGSQSSVKDRKYEKNANEPMMAE